MADVFLSYSREDRAIAQDLASALEANGYSVWWDRNIPGGAHFIAATEAELNAAKAVLVVWTQTSIASHWVADEAGAGRDTGRLTPITTDGSTPPLGFRQFQVLDFVGWTGSHSAPAFQDLLSALARLAPDRIPAIPAVPAFPAVAVLPFVNVSADPEQEYFSDGLSEELISQFAQIKGLRTAGRASSFAFKARSIGAREIGEKLGVTHLLEGSVRKAGARVRITAQLTSCVDGFQLWSERFDRELTDVFAVQDEIAMAVATALRITLGVDKVARRADSTSNVEAFDLLLRARAIVRRRQPGDAERAIELLRQVIAIDPDFSLAWNVLGNALTSVLSWDPPHRAQVTKDIDTAYERSISLAPDVWTAHEARCNQLELRHDWVGAEVANARALALAPGSMREPIMSRANQLSFLGRLSESLPFARRAAEIEPMAPMLLQVFLDLVGRHGEAEADYARSKDLPSDQFLSNYSALHRALAMRDHTLARERLGLCAQVIANPRSPLRLVQDVFDDPARAKDLIHLNLDRILHPEHDITRSITAAQSWAMFAAYFDENAGALRAWRATAPYALGVQIKSIWHPGYAGMRKLPGFRDLLDEVGLVAYWRTTGSWGDLVRPTGPASFEVVG